MNKLSRTTRLRVLILFILLVGALIPGTWTLARTGDWDGFAQNFSTEMAGALVTFFLIDLVIRSREVQETEQRKLEELKKELVARMGSSVREITASATDELRRNGWLDDGTLHEIRARRANLERIDLSKADLSNANLHRANLTQADLWSATLNGADLSGAWMEGVRLWQANLEDANLWQARLQNANLRSANLRGTQINQAKLDGADMRDADLRGATLQGARLDGTDLRGARFDADTILPDGTPWNETAELTRFTDSSHPNFWRNGQPLESNQH